MWRPFFLGAGHFLKAIAPEHAGPIKKADHKEREQTLWCATASQNSDAAGTAEYIRIYCFPILPAYLLGATNQKAGAFAMPFVVFLTLAFTGWFYAAATYQNRGYAWADQTCESMPSFCAEPHKVGIVAIAVVTMFLILRVVKS